MNDIVKNQHFVPQLYLRHFADDKEKLFVFDKPQEKVFHSSTEKVAASKYFYDVNPSLLPEGVNPQFVEKTLAEAEGKYATALAATIASIKDTGCLCPESRPALADFIAVQVMRSKAVRTHMAQTNTSLGMVLEQQSAPGAKAKYHLQDNSLSFVHAMLILGSSGEMRDCLLNQIWIGARNISMRPFITSDSPIIRNPHIQNALAPNIGFASPGIEVFIPLSPIYGLILLECKYHACLAPLEMKSLELTDENVEYYNGHQVIQSDRHLFSHAREFDGVREVLKRRPDVKDPDRQRSEFIWGGKKITLEDYARETGNG